MKDVRGKVAVVTGAASGIGRGLAERFAAEGMRVVLADVEQAALDQAERELTAAGATVMAVHTDVSKLASVEALAQATLDRFGAVHILCNNAGVGGPSSTWKSALEEWEWVLGVNLWGVIHGVRTFVPIFLKQGQEAHIVNTASVAGLIAGAGATAYTASKFGVVGLSESLFYELQMTSAGKVKISVLCAGPTNTRILESTRNHPSGPQPLPAEGTRERMMLEKMKGALKSGMDPSETAQMVFDAIVEGRFYVVTHPKHNPTIEQRSAALTNGGPPVWLGGG